VVSKQALEHAHYLIHQEQKKCIKFISISVMKIFRALFKHKIKYGITQDKTAKNELSDSFEQLHVLEY
jgi:hypothetical protein